MKLRKELFILCAVAGASFAIATPLCYNLLVTSATPTTEVSITNVSAKPNELVAAEIMIHGVEAPGVCATTINLTYNSSVVTVISVNSGDFDAIECTINNSQGFTKIVTYQTGAAGLIGNATFAEIEFTAVGKEGEVSSLNLEVQTLADNVGISIPYEVNNGSFFIEHAAQFDTNSPESPYPSIGGTHNGTIKPTEAIAVHKLYTYPCIGTGGHSDYVKIWNASWNATAQWEGYTGDWQNITFEEDFVLQPNEEYNYTIHTGSYLQIHHTPTLSTPNGWINCTEFVDANGKKHNDWIPSLRLGL